MWSEKKYIYIYKITFLEELFIIYIGCDGGGRECNVSQTFLPLTKVTEKKNCAGVCIVPIHVCVHTYTRVSSIFKSTYTFEEPVLNRKNMFTLKKKTTCCHLQLASL